LDAFFFAAEATGAAARFLFLEPVAFGSPLIGLNLGFLGMAAG
jgi:hypothetical protein